MVALGRLGVGAVTGRLSGLAVTISGIVGPGVKRNRDVRSLGHNACSALTLPAEIAAAP